MNLPTEVLSLKTRKPKTTKPAATKVTQLDWRGRAAELIAVKMDNTAQTYLDRAMDALQTVWPSNYALEGKTEEERDRQARKQAQRTRNFETIATMCTQATVMKGTPQERARKIIDALINRKMLDVIQLFIESLVKRVGVSAYFEYRRYMNHTAVNPDVAAANLEQMRLCHELNGTVLEGEDGETLFAEAFAAVHDRGEDVAESEDHTRDAPSAMDPIPIAATSAEDAEMAALAVQQWASTYWRLMTNNSKGEDVLPFAIERVDVGVYRNYTDFISFCDFRTEQYNARLQREKMEGMEALQSVRNRMISDDFHLPGE